MANRRIDLDKISLPNEEIVVHHDFPQATPYQERNPYHDDGGLGDHSAQLRELWRRINKHKWLIALIAVIATTVVTIEVFRIKSIYQASATVEIKSENRTLFRSGDVVVESDEADYGYYASLAMKSKIRVLQSRPLLEDVVVNLKLDQNPRFLDVTKQKTTWEALRSISSKFGESAQSTVPPVVINTSAVQLAGTIARSPAESARLSPFVDVLAGNLTTESIEGTKMLTISFKHSDPALAAAVVNTVAQVFIQYSSKNRDQKYTDTSSWLDTRTRELRAKVEQAEQELANYTSSHNIFSTDGKENLTTEKLTKLHTQAMQSETERILKQSLYEEVKQGRVAQLPESYSDSRLVTLQTKLGDLQTQAAQLSSKFGPDNPNLIEVQKQTTAIQAQINESRKTLEGKLKADYERAVRDELALKEALEQAKTEAVRQTQAAIQFSILKQNVETAKALYTDFLQKTNQASIQVANKERNVEVIEPAGIPVVPIGPNRLRTILIGLFLSLAIGVVLAFVIEYLNNTIKTVDDVSHYINLPALAVIPAMNGNASRLLSAKKGSTQQALTVNGHDASQAAHNAHAHLIHLLTGDNHSLFAEAYRGLRTSVLLSTAGSPPKTILFTSSQPSEGKTTTTINTAVSLAQLGLSVLIIDADMRRPAVHKAFGVGHAQGLSTYLSREVEVDSLIQQLPIPNLSLMTCGPIPPNPAELVSSERMKELLRLLATRYDHILIDSPPLINVTDPIVLSTLVNGVILVVQGGRSKRGIVRRARQELASVGAKIFGVVLNNVDLKHEGYDDYYYYRYHSNYYGQERSESNGN